MNAAENKQLMQYIFDELSKGNTKPFVENLAEDVRWTVIGTTKFSRTFHGKQAVLTELMGQVRSQMAARIIVTAHRFIAEGDHVVVEGRGQGTTKAGDAYNNTYCWVYRLAEGQAHEVTEYLDTELVAAALGR